MSFLLSSSRHIRKHLSSLPPCIYINFYPTKNLRQCVRQRCTIPDSRQELYGDLVEGEDKTNAADLVDRYFHVPTMVHQVLVIQPFIRHGVAAKKDTNNQLMLEESLAMVRTLGWKVVDYKSIGLASFRKPFLFGSGKLTELDDLVSSNQKITAVYVSLYQLTLPQRLELENTFNVPVIDRYNLVLQIFFQHAQSRESKLQVALAEIPYLKNRLMVEHEYERGNKHSGDALGEQFFQKKRFVLKQLEGGIRKRIEQLRGQRQKLRSQRKDREIPTVAVLGYTNCGKTSLIKAITGNVKMQPKDQLFATLDVTCHGIKLPTSNMEAVFIDTVGFISDIPTPLIASFSSTLEDALYADQLLHVVDYSNPDWEHQMSQVLGTLRRLKVPAEAMQKMVTVGNKIDKLPHRQWVAIKENGSLPISATKGYGLEHLVGILEEKLITGTGRLKVVMKVRPGGQEWEWLHRNSSVGKVEVMEKDNNFNLVTLVITAVQMEKFKALFVRGT